MYIYYIYFVSIYHYFTCCFCFVVPMLFVVNMFLPMKRDNNNIILYIIIYKGSHEIMIINTLIKGVSIRGDPSTLALHAGCLGSKKKLCDRFFRGPRSLMGTMRNYFNLVTPSSGLST